MNRAIVLSVVCFGITAASVAEEGDELRSVTNADSVVAIYRQSLGKSRDGQGPWLIFAAWPDGQVVWSENRLKGGSPYRVGHTDPAKIALTVERFDKDGLFNIKGLDRSNFGPDSQFQTVFIKSGKKQLKMESWHELYETSEVVALDTGLESLQGRMRLDVLQKSPRETLFYRFVWSETKAKLFDLIPAESTVVDGRLVQQLSGLSWKGPSAPLRVENTKELTNKP